MSSHPALTALQPTQLRFRAAAQQLLDHIGTTTRGSQHIVDAAINAARSFYLGNPATAILEPGDSTRYVITATPLDADLADVLGGDLLVSMTGPSPWACIVSTGGFYTPDYIAEKAQDPRGFNARTAITLTAYLNLFCSAVTALHDA